MKAQDEWDSLRAGVRAEWGRLTAFRLGMTAERLKSPLAARSPYPKDSRADRMYREGVRSQRMHEARK